MERTVTARAHHETAIRVTARPAHELLLSLVAFSTPSRVDSYEVGAQWFADVDARLDDPLRAKIARLSNGCEHILIRLFDVAIDLPPTASGEAFVSAVEALEPARLRLTLLGYFARRSRRRVDPAVILEAARGDGTAARRLIEDNSDGPECERALANVLGLTDEAAAELAVSTLRAWQERVFDGLWAEVGPLLADEAERLRGRSRELGLDAFLAEATNGADVIAAPDVEEIEVFPTWVLRPWNVFWERGTTQVVGVAAQLDDRGSDPDAPPQRLVQLARALGDDRRLRVLRRLTTGSYTLQELAEHFGIPKTTLLHHLVILRSAGIVRVGAGPTGRYSLRPRMPVDLHRLLDGYLPAVTRNGSPGGSGFVG
jgi:DNA-binding transcriptional ArsR family regulator